jgi:hypothetical protein
MKNFLLMYCISLLVVSNARAITVSESTDFPSNSFRPTETIGSLDLGVNTISGSLSGFCETGEFSELCSAGNDNDSSDRFSLVIEDHYKIDSIFVTTSNLTGPRNFEPTFSFVEVSQNLVRGQGTRNNGTAKMNLDIFNLNPGEYNLSMHGDSALERGPYALDWSIEVNVSAIPIPAAIWLFMSGCVCLLGSRRSNLG